MDEYECYGDIKYGFSDSFYNESYDDVGYSESNIEEDGYGY